MTESHENNEASTSDSKSLSRRRALGLGAAVAGGVWAAPVIMSFDAASATSSGGAPTTSTTYVAPTTTESTTTTSTTAAPRTITASVTGAAYGLTNPSPVTVAVGQPIDLVFTHDQSTAGAFAYRTYDGTAVAGVDYTAVNSSVFVQFADATVTVTIQTTATGAGANTSFTVGVAGGD